MYQINLDVSTSQELNGMRLQLVIARNATEIDVGFVNVPNALLLIAFISDQCGNIFRYLSINDR